jgi:general secretion pathway protein A
MYEAFYGLREKPFNLTPDPRYLYLSEKHKEAFAHLLFGIKARSGFVMVSGEIGTGKTTICRTLLNQIDAQTDVAFIFNPCLSQLELLRNINEEFGIDTEADTVRGLVDELNQYLLQAAADDKGCVLVIDEAQNLEPTVLEQIRLLSNLETETQKLLQIVLIGQPELAESLALPELRQLNQRITARYHLKALDREETLQYIAYRLRVAGGRKQVRFSRRDIQAIYRHSKGTPRVINAVCDRALLMGYTKETRQITPAIVQRAINEIRGEEFRVKKKRGGTGHAYGLAKTAIGAVAVVLVAAMYFLTPQTQTRWTAPPVSQVTRPASPAFEGPTLTSPAVEAAVRGERIVPLPVKAVPSDFELQLRSLGRDAARQAAAAKLLRMWNLALIGEYPADDTLASLEDFASANGLASEALTPSLTQLGKLGLPAFIKLHTADDWLWISLASLGDDEAKVTMSGRDMADVPITDLAAHYRGEAVVLWRDPSPEAETLRPDVKGPAVHRLQSRLKQMGMLNGPLTGAYDDTTAAAVTTLQEQTGLKVDGLAGRQTRMVMSSWLPTGHAPSLRPSIDPAPVETAALVEIGMPSPVPLADDAAEEDIVSELPSSLSLQAPASTDQGQSAAEPNPMSPQDAVGPASPPVPHADLEGDLLAPLLLDDLLELETLPDLPPDSANNEGSSQLDTATGGGASE